LSQPHFFLIADWHKTAVIKICAVEVRIVAGQFRFTRLYPL